MASSSAIIDVVVERKEISSVLKSNSQNSCSIQNSLVQSSSFGSLSTITDIENFSELNIDDNEDISIRVHNPLKVIQTLETYIAYKVTTKVARVEFSKNEYTVQRRYNDFIWLRQKLLENHTFCIIPLLPEKHSLIGHLDRYSKEFIVARTRNLDAFMKRVALHPVLSKNEHFYKFVTFDSLEFLAHKKKRHHASPKIDRPDRPADLDKTRSYLTAVSDKLVGLERIAGRIAKEGVEHLAELNDFHPVFRTWATVENELRPVLTEVADALEKCARAQDAAVRCHGSTVVEPVRDLLNYIEAAQEAIRRTEHFCREMDEKHSGRKRSSVSHPNSKVNDQSEPTSCPETSEIRELESYSLVEDMERWQSDKSRCIRKILLEFVNKQIEYEQSRVEAWEPVVKKFTSNPSLVKNKMV